MKPHGVSRTAAGLRRVLKTKAFALAAIFVAAPGLCAAQTASERLEQLATQVQERVLDLFPVSEMFNRGPGPRQDRLELSLSDEHRERQRAHHRSILSKLERIAAAELSPTEQITHALLGWRARESLDGLAHPFHQHSAFIHLTPGVAFFLIDVIAAQPFRNEADYRAWFRRVQRYPAFLASVEGVMRDGAAAGITTPRVLVERTLEQIETLAPDDMTTSALWRPIRRLPRAVDAETRTRLEAEYRGILADEMFPALRRLASFVRSDYLPAARTTDGFGALPGGDRMYRLAVREATTTDLTPDDVHALGLSEVKRIQAAFLAAARKAGFDGKMSEASAWLRGNTENYPFTTSAQVIEHLQGIHARIVPQLPALFGRLPKARFEIRLTDPAVAATTPARYLSPSDAGRPGIFAMPVVDPRKVSRADLAALLAHEGMPGHHLEIGVKLENKVPEFRRRLWVNAYGEGWALYAESLGHELGLYEEPLELVGRYLQELLRACRLVADTSIHAKGWMRTRAIQYLVEECGLPEGWATVEVLRYMAWPAQALSYKVGELAILDLRAEAARRLGARFDLRAFHDALLAEGNMPISMLRRRMETWIETQGQ
ncbi:MAG: DUF885 domain-containing protein [Xanthobacteraceae bacterium]